MYLSFSPEFNSGFFKDYLDLILKSEKEYTRKFEEEVSNFFGMDQTFNKKSRESREDFLANINYGKYEMRQIMYGSFVVAVFIFIESQLLETCKLLQNYKNQIFSYNDLKGSGMKEMLSYIKKLLKKDLFSDGALTQKLFIAQTIRNSIVHNNGEIPASKLENVRLYLKNNKRFFRIDQDNKVILQNWYLSELVSLSREVSNVVSKCFKKYDR